MMIFYNNKKKKKSSCTKLPKIEFWKKVKKKKVVTGFFSCFIEPFGWRSQVDLLVWFVKPPFTTITNLDLWALHTFHCMLLLQKCAYFQCNESTKKTYRHVIFEFYKWKIRV